jgi:hypothetical protein
LTSREYPRRNLGLKVQIISKVVFSVIGIEGSGRADESSRWVLHSTLAEDAVQSLAVGPY